VLFIGDSVGASIGWYVGSLFAAGGYDVHFDAVSGRCTLHTPNRCNRGDAWSALDALDAGYHPKLAIIELGYNDTKKALALGIDTLMKDLLDRGVKKVLWINLSERRPDSQGGSAYAPYNAVIRAAAKKWPQLDFLDWNSASSGNDAAGWFLPFSKGRVDLIHLNVTGEKRFAQFIVDELDRLRAAGALPDPDGVVPASAPTTTTPKSSTTLPKSDTSGVPAAKRPELKIGDTGSYVTDLQNALLAHGYQTEADGQFGAGTERVVKAFQKAAGLVPDGRVGKRSWKALGF
jgi:hypothetical protein